MTQPADKSDAPRWYSDADLRRMWRAAGGNFHGPHVETGIMPEANLFRFLREMLDVGARSSSAPLPECGTLSGETPRTDALDVMILAASEEARAVKHACLEQYRKLERESEHRWQTLRQRERALAEAATALSATQPREPVTQDGPLGGYTVIGQEANELDLKLLQMALAVEGAMDEDASPEDVQHHTKNMMEVKREILEKYTPRSTSGTDWKAKYEAEEKDHRHTVETYRGYIEPRYRAAVEALERLLSYSMDIRDSRINYRAEDHIQVIEGALYPTPQPAPTSALSAIGERK